MSEPFVSVEVTDRVAILRIDHPPVNSLDTATFRDLEAAVGRALADTRVKVIVITGTGRSFVAGADIGDLSAMSTVADAKAKADAGHALFSSIEQSPKPVIAAINGRYCLGGGNELALACHLRIAEEKTKLGQPEITLGLIPGWGATQRLPRLVGPAKAIELILTGEPIRASEAYRIGLVNKVVPEGEALAEALRWANRLARLSAVALSRALDAIRTGLTEGYTVGLEREAHLFAEMADTEDVREGLGAFLEKRKPQFKDR